MDLSFLGNHVGELATIVGSSLALVSSLLNRGKITKVSLSLNGRLSELIAAERRLAEQQIGEAESKGYAKGLAAGVVQADTLAAKKASDERNGKP